MIRTILIEDEPDQMEGMVQLLARYCPDVEVVATAADKTAAIEAILTHQPDLVFLDIQLMGDTSAGFDVLESVRFMDFELIFLSSHTEFALRAVTLERPVCYFLEKPVQIDKTVMAVKKAMHTIDLKQSAGVSRSIRKRLAVPSRHGLELIRVRDIIRCEADGWLTKVHIAGREKMLPVSKHLGWFAGQLPEDIFVRVHHSHIVHLGHISAYHAADGGQLILINGAKVPVGPHYKEGLLQKLHRY